MQLLGASIALGALALASTVSSSPLRRGDALIQCKDVFTSPQYLSINATGRHDAHQRGLFISNSRPLSIGGDYMPRFTWQECNSNYMNISSNSQRHGDLSVTYGRLLVNTRDENLNNVTDCVGRQSPNHPDLLTFSQQPCSAADDETQAQQLWQRRSTTFFDQLTFLGQPIDDKGNGLGLTYTAGEYPFETVEGVPNGSANAGHIDFFAPEASSP